VAAAVVVINHLRAVLPVSPSLCSAFPADAAVGFFFVLSGFVLAHAYPTLEGIGVKAFLLARLGRVYPAYFATSILLVAIVPSALLVRGQVDLLAVVSNLLLLQTWWPREGRFVSLNAPSWSVSTELAFYVAFPWLIRKWARVGIWVPLIAIVLGLTVIACVHVLAVDAQGFIYEHPLVRVIEFVCGMGAARIWRSVSGRRGSVSPLIATVAEVVAVGLLGGVLSFRAELLPSSVDSPSALILTWWARTGVLIAPFCLLLVSFGINTGLFAKALSARLFVFMGEISYAVYLIHDVINRIIADHAPAFSRVPPVVGVVVYAVVLLALAYIVTIAIELPVRRLAARRLRKASQRHAASGSVTKTWKRVLVAAAMTVTSVAGVWVAFDVGLDLRSRVGNSEPGPRLAVFGERFELRRVVLARDGEWLRLELEWRSLSKQPLSYRVGVHAVDTRGLILAQADHKQAFGGTVFEAETIWLDRLAIPIMDLDNASRLGICLYDLHTMLAVTASETDWDGHRLLIHLPGSAFSPQPAP